MKTNIHGEAFTKRQAFRDIEYFVFLIFLLA
jgi:hypothetical protein